MFFYLYIDNGPHSFALGGLEANLAIIGQKVEHPLGKSPVCFRVFQHCRLNIDNINYCSVNLRYCESYPEMFIFGIRNIFFFFKRLKKKLPQPIIFMHSVTCESFLLYGTFTPLFRL